MTALCMGEEAVLLQFCEHWPDLWGETTAIPVQREVWDIPAFSGFSLYFLPVRL